MIGQIENAIIERIKAAHDSGALGYKLKQIKSYAGEVNDDPKKAARNFPAVWLIYRGSRRTGNGNNPKFVSYIAQFYIVCAAKSLRNESHSRHGKNNKVGASQISEDCVSILHHFAPDIQGVKRFIAGDVEPLFADRSDKDLASVYAAGLGVPYDFQPEQFLSDEERPLEKVHTNWDLPPDYETFETLPDDELADATSHIEGTP